jgi:asparagine synthase (glutamine-hydrolysing)
MVHRGPDDEGDFVENNLGIAMRRLSIIDLASGRQPIHNEDESKWIVFNGEIFNYRELKELLVKKGHQFCTASDTETILHLYEEFGDDCLKYLRGMFAFAIWDRNSQSLFLARDRVGIKPLFYSIVDGQSILFASEMKALLPSKQIDTRMDLQALDAYFTYSYIPSPLTIYQGVRKLPPGHLMKITRSGVSLKKYWDLQFQPDYTKNEAYFLERFLEIFDEAVRIRLLSEVPLGAFLSGGVDSSMVVAHMARSMAEAPNTFSIGFGGNSSSHIDERPYARVLAHKYACNHTDIQVEPRGSEILGEIVTAFDEPFADDSVIPSYYICKASREAVTVALTGLGGDELFGGYERYLGFRLSELYSHIPGFLSTHVIRPLVESLPEQKSGHYLVNHMKRFMRASQLDPPLRYASYVSTLASERRGELFSGDVAKQVDFDSTNRLMTDYYSSDNAQNPLDRAFYQDIKTYLPDDILTLTDRIGMVHSQELRVPFTDHVLMEFCATIPAKMKLKHFTKKYLLRKAAENLIPQEVLAHRKQGFSSPMAQWLKEDLQELREDLLSRSKIESGGIFNWEFVKKVTSEHLNRKELHDKLIFALIMFQKWQEEMRESQT